MATLTQLLATSLNGLSCQLDDPAEIFNLQPEVYQAAICQNLPGDFLRLRRGFRSAFAAVCPSTPTKTPDFIRERQEAESKPINPPPDQNLHLELKTKVGGRRESPSLVQDGCVVDTTVARVSKHPQPSSPVLGLLRPTGPESAVTTAMLRGGRAEELCLLLRRMSDSFLSLTSFAKRQNSQTTVRHKKNSQTGRVTKQQTLSETIKHGNKNS